MHYASLTKQRRTEQWQCISTATHGARYFYNLPCGLQSVHRACWVPEGCSFLAEAFQPHITCTGGGCQPA